MKNLFIICVMFLFLGMFNSCKKDYTCECTIAGATTTTEIMDAKKGDAEDACDALQTAGQLIDPEASCSLD